MKRGWVLLVGVVSVIAGSVVGTAVGHHPAPGGPDYYGVGQACDPGGDEPTEPGLLQVFFKDGEYENTLSIAQIAGPAPVVSDGTTTTPLIVRGQLGTATPGHLQWSEDGQVFVITSNTYAYTMLSTVELVAIADSLR